MSEAIIMNRQLTLEVPEGCFSITPPALTLVGEEKKEEPNPYVRDSAHKVFGVGDEAKMNEFLLARETSAQWRQEVPVRQMEAVLDKDQSETGLALAFLHIGRTHTYPLRDCAISTMLDRAGIKGPALGRMQKVDLVEIVNKCFPVAMKDATTQIRIAEGRISAVLSSQYVIVSIPEVFEEAATVITHRFPKAVFAGGLWTHSITTCEWALGKEGKLVEAYTAALKRHGIEAEDIQPALRITSSDVGASGVNLTPKLVVGKDAIFLPVSGSLRMEHKAGASIEKLLENLDTVFGTYQDKLSELVSLLDVPIEHPEGCFDLVTKILHIPKKYAEPARESFMRGFLRGEECTAHDVYIGLSEIMFQLQIQEVTGKQALQIEDAIAGALALDWQKHDKPLKED